MSNWTTEQIPDQTNRIFVITGANSGLGLEATRVLAQKGAQVVLACRNLQKAQDAMDAIRNAQPDARLDVIPCDLADLGSVKKFAETFQQRYDKLDVLINNAGIMNVLEGRTKDGFERQFGTNHLGHFALTSHLISSLRKGSDARVVTTSSLMHHSGDIHFDDLNLEQEYGGNKAYSQSKLANLLFALELNRRLQKSNLSIISNACHPGWTATNLQYLRAKELGSKLRYVVTALLNKLAGQSVEKGVLPTLYAATALEAEGGAYYGPSGWKELHGPPAPAQMSEKAQDEEKARELWKLSEELTGVPFVFYERA